MRIISTTTRALRRLYHVQKSRPTDRRATLPLAGPPTPVKATISLRIDANNTVKVAIKPAYDSLFSKRIAVNLNLHCMQDAYERDNVADFTDFGRRLLALIKQNAVLSKLQKLAGLLPDKAALSDKVTGLAWNWQALNHVWGILCDEEASLPDEMKKLRIAIKEICSLVKQPVHKSHKTFNYAKWRIFGEIGMAGPQGGVWDGANSPLFIMEGADPIPLSPAQKFYYSSNPSASPPPASPLSTPTTTKTKDTDSTMFGQTTILTPAGQSSSTNATPKDTGSTMFGQTTILASTGQSSSTNATTKDTGSTMFGQTTILAPTGHSSSTNTKTKDTGSTMFGQTTILASAPASVPASTAGWWM